MIKKLGKAWNEYRSWFFWFLAFNGSLQLTLLNQPPIDFAKGQTMFWIMVCCIISLYVVHLDRKYINPSKENEG